MFRSTQHDSPLMKNALILVDLQNDFLPGGALAVPHGDEVIPLADELQSRFDLVVATQDWHPSDHGSFAANHPGKNPGDRIILDGIEQILWPVHCVQNTHGAEFAPLFDTSRLAHVFHKGTEKNIDSYSTFFDNAHRRHTGLAHYLEKRGIKNIYLMGLALDYCVKYSALDARHLGLNTYVIVDGCRGIELEPGDIARALDDMKRAGAVLLKSPELSGELESLTPPAAVNARGIATRADGFWRGSNAPNPMRHGKCARAA
jgi:nicotinamidase/pyrazinamidase